MSDMKKFLKFLKISKKNDEASCCEPGTSCCGPAEKQPETSSKALRVFDPPMCCSTGVCGPKVDPALVRFAADLKWLESQGMTVRRYNLAQSPEAFVSDEAVSVQLSVKGEAALPLILLDGKVIASGAYPSRDKLIESLGLSATYSLFSPTVAELVAIGASIAANCDSCLRYHIKAAKEMGVSAVDIKRAVELAAKVKEQPHNTILKLAERLVQSEKNEQGSSDSHEK